jgi:hypothetical protein
MRELGYYKVNYYGKWYVLEYSVIGTKENPRYQWVGTIDGNIINVLESEIFEVGEKVL